MEKQLKAQGKSRHDVGREEFHKLMQAWTRDCKKTIMGQLERLGCLLDMEREAFTMDEVRARSVMHAFQDFASKGLIYRGERMINWCPRCHTALSNEEAEPTETEGRLWHLRYPLAGAAWGAAEDAAASSAGGPRVTRGTGCPTARSAPRPRSA